MYRDVKLSPKNNLSYKNKIFISINFNSNNKPTLILIWCLFVTFVYFDYIIINYYLSKSFKQVTSRRFEDSRMNSMS